MSRAFVPDLMYENFLRERVSKMIADVFNGLSDVEMRKARIRKAIIAGGLEGKIAGKDKDGNFITIDTLFERVYREPLQQPEG